MTKKIDIDELIKNGDDIPTLNENDEGKDGEKNVGYGTKIIVGRAAKSFRRGNGFRVVGYKSRTYVKRQRNKSRPGRRGHKS